MFEILIYIVLPILIIIVAIIFKEVAMGVAIILLLGLFLPIIFGISLFIHIILGPSYWYNRRKRWHLSKNDYQIYINNNHIEIIYDWDEYFYRVFKKHHYYKNNIKIINIKSISECITEINSEFIFKLNYFNDNVKYGKVFLPGKSLKDIYKLELYNTIPFYNFPILYLYNKKIQKGEYNVIFIELDNRGKKLIVDAIN